jgi:hypothetical protein
MLVLEEIYVYPIKSLPGVRVSQSAVKEKGLEFDRRMMLTDTSGVFLTQRSLPLLSQFEMEMKDEMLTVRSRINPDREFSMNLKEDKSGEKFLSQVWDDEVETIEFNPDFSAWFSDELSLSCRLVYFPEQAERITDPDYVPMKQHVSLSDGFPFMIIGQESLKDLNKRLSEPVTMNRFRPNFVYSGGYPYQEDEFKTIKIGASIFKGVKPCSRCVFTTVDQITGKAGKEPLQTLSGYRKKNNQVYFGMNLIAGNENLIKQGDEIHLL